ncbi:hypothetical protein [Streptomyces sp. NPDC050263]|uniref:hypothetical protein n=1 Tax=Streptomyces sp. NPDC050263 TaxID=3155037 RepID=UPI003427343E
MRTGASRSWRHQIDSGSGNCKKFDHNFGEGRTVIFRACNDTPYLPDPCSAWRTGVA